MQGVSPEFEAILCRIDACMHAQPDEALRLCAQIISEATKRREPLAHLRAAERYGRIMDHQGKGLQAHNILFSAQQVAQSARLFNDEAGLLEQIARGYYTAGQYRLALQYWARCVELVEQVNGDAATWIHAKIGLAQVYYGAEDWNSALALLMNAQTRIGEVDDPKLDAKISINLGVGFFETGRLDDATEAYGKALTICVAHGFFDYVAESNWRLAQVDLAAGHLDTAPGHLDAALLSARQVNYRWCEAHALATQAEIHARQGACDKAMHVIHAAQTIAREDNFLHMLAQHHFAAARYAETMGVMDDALHEFKAGHACERLLETSSAARHGSELEEKAGLRLTVNRLLVELSNSHLIDDGDPDPAFHLITEQGCRIVGVSRAIVWMFDDANETLSCRCLYVADTEKWSMEAPLRRTDCPSFFSRLSDPSALVAHDAAHHSYTWDLHAVYLEPRAIQSILAYPIRVAGQTQAVLCFEVADRQHNWTPDEIANGHQIAEISARVLASHERKLFQHEIGDLNARLMEANEVLEARVVERTSALEERNRDLQVLNDQLIDMQNQLLQSEKMASIGQLAAGVAHEINNPIGYVYSNLSSLEKYIYALLDMMKAYEAAESQLPPTAQEQLAVRKREAELDYLLEDLPQLMEESKEGITRVKKIVMDLRAFSHSDTGEMTLHDLNAGLKSTLNLVNGELQKHAKVFCSLGELPPVECSLARLNQVFLNLLVNAGHALEGRKGGEILVRTGCDGSEVWIAISDNGCGIKPENRKKIFDAFFTTKPIGKGTGLGLSLSYSIMQSHHGRIDLESEEGVGTTFTLRLPVTQPAEKGSKAAA